MSKAISVMFAAGLILSGPWVAAASSAKSVQSRPLWFGSEPYSQDRAYNNLATTRAKGGGRMTWMDAKRSEEERARQELRAQLLAPEGPARLEADFLDYESATPRAESAAGPSLGRYRGQTNALSLAKSRATPYPVKTVDVAVKRSSDTTFTADLSRGEKAEGLLSKVKGHKLGLKASKAMRKRLLEIFDDESIPFQGAFLEVRVSDGEHSAQFVIKNEELRSFLRISRGAVWWHSCRLSLR